MSAFHAQGPVIDIPGCRRMQSSFECCPPLSPARTPDHQMSRRYSRSPRLLPLGNSDRLPVFCCSDELVAGVTPQTGLLVSAFDPDYISRRARTLGKHIQVKHLGEPQ